MVQEFAHIGCRIAIAAIMTARMVAAIAAGIRVRTRTRNHGCQWRCRCVICEPMSGATLGAVVRLRDICKSWQKFVERNDVYS